MAITTIYDVKLRYNVDGNLPGAMNKSNAAATGLGRTLSWIGTLAAGAFGFSKAKSVLVDFNSTMEQSRIQMSGMIQLNAKNMDWNQSLGLSNKLIDRLQQRAKASVGTTKDFVDMASMITRPILAAGMSMKDLEEITAGAVVSAKAFNKEADYAARDIEQALAGTLSKKDMFAQSILGPTMIKGKQFTNELFNALKPAERAAHLKKAMGQEALLNMAKAQENSFDGVFSTLVDNLQIALGKIGLPLFVAIKDEIKGWNGWLDRNKATVAEISRSLASGLMKGFQMAKDAISFLVRNKDMLMVLAKAIIAFKATKSMADTVGSIGSAMMSLSKNGVGAATALAVFAAAAMGMAALIDAEQEKAIQGQVDRSSAMNLGARATYGQDVGSARVLLQDLKDSGVLDKHGNVNAGKLESQFTAGARDPFERQDALNQMVVLLSQIKIAQQLVAKNQSKIDWAKLEAANSGFLAAMNMAMTALGKKDPWTTGLNSGKPSMNVTIRKIEVQSDDPDRFVFALAETISNAVKKPGQARRTMRQ